MTWNQPAVIISLIALVISPVVPYLMLRKQSKNQYALESRKLQSSNVRVALGVIHDLTVVLRSVQDELLDRDEVNEMGLDDCLNQVRRELGPKLSQDKELNELLQWTQLHMTSYKMNKIPDFDNFLFRVNDVTRAVGDSESGQGEVELKEFYLWIKKFTHYAILQRNAYDDLVENLGQVQGALNRRLS